MTIEDIQNLKKISGIKTKYGLSPNRKTKVEKVILDKLNIPKDSLKKRLLGLEKEDEFFLLLLMVAEIEQITPLDQKQLVNNKKYTIPDFLLSVNVPKIILKSKKPMAQRMFVEVKKCKDDEIEFCITKEAYQKLRFYSQLYTLPLYFAIKFNTKFIKQWFFVSGEIIEKLSKQENREIINRKQDCYVISVTELLEKDMSSLWLNNHVALLKQGTIIEKEYDKSIKKAHMIGNKLGALISHTITYEKNQLTMDLNKKDLFLEAVIFSTLLKKLAQGNRSQQKIGNKTIVKYEADNNYFVPYYHIILEAYLHLRKQFKSALNETDDSIEYYINNFSDFDRNLIAYVKKGYYDLVDAGLLTPIRMMPNLDKKKK